MHDFIKIFRSSKVSDALLNLINKESEKRLKGNLQSIQVSELPTRRFDHPEIRAQNEDEEVQNESDDGGVEKRHKKISVIMRA